MLTVHIPSNFKFMQFQMFNIYNTDASLRVNYYHGPLVKCGITEFRLGIPDVLLTHEKNFTVVIIGYISIRFYDVW